jgi:hypothetical protein
MGAEFECTGAGLEGTGAGLEWTGACVTVGGEGCQCTSVGGTYVWNWLDEVEGKKPRAGVNEHVLISAVKYSLIRKQRFMARTPVGQIILSRHGLVAAMAHASFRLEPDRNRHLPP